MRDKGQAVREAPPAAGAPRGLEPPESAPQPQTKAPGSEGLPAGLEEILEAEIAYLRHHRHPARQPDEVAHNLVGLTLSGGGIRSATTGLGVLQALSQMRILPLVDYLCTVSGGGYVGACLTSLLSLDDSVLKRRPAASARENGSGPVMAPGSGSRPASAGGAAFSTEWARFPFRPERTDRLGLLGADLVAHLRTHGNFLITRLGLARRETMRGIGHIMTGVVYNVGLFLLTLFTVSALYLAAALLIVPDMPDILGAESAAPASGDTAAVALVERDSTVERIVQAACPAGDAECVQETRTALTALTLGDRVGRNFSIAGAVLSEAFGSHWLPALRPRDDGDPGAAPLGPFAWSLLAGALTSVIALVLICRGRALLGGSARAEHGESRDDAFERQILRRLAWGTLALLILTLVALRYGYCGQLRGPCWSGAARISPAMELTWLFVPAALMAAAWFTSFLAGAGLSGLKAWSLKTRSLWDAFQAITLYGFGITIGIGVAPLLIYALRDHQFAVGSGAIGSLVVTRLLASRRALLGSKVVRLAAWLRKALLGLAAVLVVMLTLLYFGAMLSAYDEWDGPAIALAVATLAFLGLARMVDHNKLGLHYFYRDRLAETYLLSELQDKDGRLHTLRDSMEMPLSRLNGELEPIRRAADGAAHQASSWRNPAPYHLISAAINLAGSRDLTRKDRKSGYWLFSQLFCGSTHTGFRPTQSYRRGETKLSRAITISGAAASSAIGTGTFFAQAFAMVLFNIRLGYWMENPKRPESLEHREGALFWPTFLLKEVMSQTTEHDRLVNLSDGGHTGDNLGLYPLLQRRCKIIIAVDAERDPKLGFGSFTEALRHAYVDLGIDIDIDLRMLRPDPATGFSRSHCAIGRIRYPDRPRQHSYLIYLKNSLTGDEPAPMTNYKAMCEDFPHETTVDQFFDDAQFESYRALGVHITETTFSDWTRKPEFEYIERFRAQGCGPYA